MSANVSQTRANRRLAIGLGLFAAAVFLSFIVRQWLASA